jgi:hypothetical protein
VSPISIRTDYMMGFVFGVICLAIGISLVLFQFFTKGYLFDFSYWSEDPYSIFAGYTSIAIVSLFAGVILIHRTYLIFVPLKNTDSFSTLTRDCPFCGAMAKKDSNYCEKCGQLLD